jgi:hypothetical protein
MGGAPLLADRALEENDFLIWSSKSKNALSPSRTSPPPCKI